MKIHCGSRCLNILIIKRCIDDNIIFIIYISYKYIVRSNMRFIERNLPNFVFFSENHIEMFTIDAPALSKEKLVCNIYCMDRPKLSVLAIN